MKTQNIVTKNSSPLDKITLFQSLFQGRNDLYLKGFKNQITQKPGYFPACGNEWVYGICEKPKIKCSECKHKRFLPLTEDVIRWHLSGHDDTGKEFVLGIYPLLLDETCFFLVVNFDQPAWQDVIIDFRNTCHTLQIPIAVERSSSGKGARVWIFFSEKIPAILVRKLGSHLVTEAMEHSINIYFDAYDHLVPSQDTLPQGSYGNLIALPLQKKARDQGNTLFIDDALLP
ncbi:MAG: restriction endonuclease subunit R, partial [Chlamydiia bacterium]|nr:restriction endonuclease subunit R [Chlamydiia bacterium]